MQVDYAKAQKAQQKQNNRLVRNPIPNEEMRGKICRKASRIKVKEEELLELYGKSLAFRKMFAEKANRQSIHEKTFFEALNKEWEGEEVEKLPAHGKNAIYLEGGKLVSLEEKSPWNVSKSLDFRLEVAGQTFLICHKFTNQSGGAQDNQFADVQSLLLQSRGCRKAHVIAVCDGAYYNEERMAHLNNHFTTKKVHVCSSDGLTALIENLIK